MISTSEEIKTNNLDNPLTITESNIITSNISSKESNYDFVEHNRIALLSKFFSENQMDRYGEFKKSSIENRKKIRSTNKIEYPRIKKIIQSVIGDNIPVSNSVQIVMHGIAKIHAGELIEEAKKIQYNDSNNNEKYIKPKPLRTKHLREARRRMIQRGVIYGPN